MKILFTRFPLESHYGGAEVQTLSLMKGLKERGHEVEFLGSCPTLLAECKQRAISYWQLAIGNPPVTKWGAISFVWRQFSMRSQLIQTAQKLTANRQTSTAIFMLSLSEKLLLTDWAVSKGIKVFWIEHDRIGRWLTHNPWFPRLRRLSNLATTIVVSDLSRDLYLKLGWKPAHIISIPNGIDLARFTRKEPTPYHLQPKEPLKNSVAPDATSTRAPGKGSGRCSQGDRMVGRVPAEGAKEVFQRFPTTFRIGCIARLTHDKGMDLFIEAIADLPNVTLTIVGQGREERNIRILAERKLKAKNYKLLASVPDIVSFYHSLDALVLPSREHDPFGLVVAEAMAAGVPTIVTDACGIAQYLTEEEALIVPAGSISALRNAIETLMEFPQLAQALAERGPPIAREKFSQERMIDAYEALICPA